MLGRAPQALLRRDRQAQLRAGDPVAGRAVGTRAPLRQVVRDPHRQVEVVALEVVAEAHRVSIVPAWPEWRGVARDEVNRRPRWRVDVRCGTGLPAAGWRQPWHYWYPAGWH